VILAFERKLAGEQLIEDNAKRPDIGGGSHEPRFAGRLFGRHVGRGAKNGVGKGHAAVGLHELGEAKVADKRFTIRVEQHVGGLEVAMEDTALMGMMDGTGDLRHEVGDGGQIVSDISGRRRIANWKL